MKSNEKNITVNLLNINGEVKQYEDVTFIKIVSEKYNLIIMQDYFPIIGDINGTIEIGRINEKIKLEKIKGYFMHKKNRFNLFY